MKKYLRLMSCMLLTGFGATAQTTIEEARNHAVPASIKETLNWDKYGLSTNPNKSTVLSKNNFGVRASSNSSGIVLGTSQYDLQTNASIDNRFFSNPDGTYSAAYIWSDQPDPYTNRGTGYLYNDGVSWTVKNPTARLETERCGWPSILYTGSGEEIVISHSTASNQLLMVKRSPKGSGTWTEIKDPTGANSAPKVGTGYLIWPRAVVAGPNNNTVHVIALTEPVPTPTSVGFNGVLVGGMDGALVYSRSDDGGNTWTVKNEIINGIDSKVYSGIGGDSYAITADGNNVAIAVFHRYGDVRVVKSTDNGRSWNTHIALDFAHDAFEFEDFAILDTPTTSDNSGDLVIDKNGMVHVFFGTWRWNDDDITDDSYSTFPLANGLGYWKESFGDGNYQQLFSFQDINNDGVIGIVGYPTNFDGFTNYGGKSTCSYPSVGIDAGGSFYLKFTNIMEDVSSTGGKLYNNGTKNFRHEWVTRSNNEGCTWSAPIDLTDDGPGFEECVYGKVPKKIDGKFRMIYMEDGTPGTAVGPEEHAVTTNEMVYVELPTSTIVASSDICVTVINGTTELCPGDNAILDASASCGTAYTWKDAAGNTLGTSSSLSIVSPDTYTCDIMTACGIQQETHVVENPQTGGAGPKVKITTTVGELCPSGSQATLKVNFSSLGSSGSIIWDGGIPATIDTFNITKPGLYTVEVANCGGTTIDTITIDTVKSVNAVVSGIQSICPGEQSTLSAPVNPDGTYNWKDGSGTAIGNTRVISVSTTGTYTVDITACGGALTGSGSISVSAEPSPTALVKIANGGSETACVDPDGGVDLIVEDNGNPSATYKWFDNTIGTFFTIPTATAQKVTVSAYSYNSCGDSALSNSITIEIFDLPNKPIITLSNNILTSNASSGLRWHYANKRKPNDWTFTGETAATYDLSASPYESGTLISATITDQTTECESERSTETYTTSVDGIVTLGDNINIYPNPSKGEFSINFNGVVGKTLVELKINNSLGQLIYENTLNLNSNHSESVNLKGLEKGVYFMNVNRKGVNSVHRIVIQ